ncbi:hypothetical protein AB2C47_30965 [Pseudomonas aeruginosa]
MSRMRCRASISLMTPAILLDVNGRLGPLLVGQQIVHLLLDVIQADLGLGDGD